MSSITPASNDILLGRGGKNYKHKGNDRIRKKAEEKALEYDRSNKKEKAAIINDLTKDLLQDGVRFLNRVRPLGQPEYWQEADQVQRRMKVSQELREAVKKRRQQVCKQGNEKSPVACPLVEKIKTLSPILGCGRQRSPSDRNPFKLPELTKTPSRLIFKASQPSISPVPSNAKTPNANEEIKQLFEEWKNEGTTEP